MSHLIALITGLFLGYIFFNKKKKTPDQILKETQKFKYIFKDSECLVYVKDQYEYEQKIVSKPSTKTKKVKGIDFERAQVLRSRKIESKYFHPKKNIEDDSHFFYGKKIVITGEFKLFEDRNDVAKLFWDVGADIDTSIGKNTKYLIVGSDYGPVKMKKAIEQNITVIDQDKLFDYFEL